MSLDSVMPTKLIAPLQTVLVLVLTVYLAALCAQLVWFVADSDEAAVMVLPESHQSSITQANKTFKSVAGLYLFGKVGATPKVKQDRPAEAPKTRLRLMLKGVFTGEQGGESGAIIEEIGKATSYYRIGEQLPGNAVLEEVYSDRVLLRRNGQLETLAFEQQSSVGSKIAKTSRPQRRSQEVDSPKKFIDEATKRLSENPEQALRSVGLSASADGGYVYQGNNPMLAGMNLEKGDVILSVNGHTLGDVQKDKALMKSLYEQGSLEVEVVRDGASFFINYPLR